MKNYILIILFSVFFSCKNETNNNSTSGSQAKDSTEIASDNNKNEKIADCGQLIYDLVASTDVIKGYDDFFTRIEKNDGDKITIQVYVENNLSDDPKKKQIVESTIAWLTFIPSESKLFNSTIDPDDPIEIKFDKKLIDEKLFKTCNINPSKAKETIKNSNDCVTEEIEMGSKEICTIKNTTLKDVYSALIKNKLFEKSEKLRPELPTTSETTTINLDGLISIDYKVTKNKTDIIMSFEGGETSIILQQKQNDVQRTIIHSAD